MPGFTVASEAPDAAVTVLSAGQEIVGGCVSGGRTVTRKVQLSPVPEVEVTVLVPTAKNDPEAGELESVPQLPVGCAVG